MHGSNNTQIKQSHSMLIDNPNALLEFTTGSTQELGAN
jgi:hypothetical protein